VWLRPSHESRQEQTGISIDSFGGAGLDLYELQNWPEFLPFFLIFSPFSLTEPFIGARAVFLVKYGSGKNIGENTSRNGQNSVYFQSLYEAKAAHQKYHNNV